MINMICIQGSTSLKRCNNRNLPIHFDVKSSTLQLYQTLISGQLHLISPNLSSTVPFHRMWQDANQLNPPWLSCCQSALFPFPSLNLTSLYVSQVKHRVNFIDPGDILTLPVLVMSQVCARQIQVGQETPNFTLVHLFQTL